MQKNTINLVRQTTPTDILVGMKTQVASITKMEGSLGDAYKFLWVDVYFWCQKIHASGKAKTISDAAEMLCVSLQRPKPTVIHWYYCGKFMADHDLNIVTTDYIHVKDSVFTQKTMSINSFGKVLAKIRSKGAKGLPTRRDLRKIIQSGQVASGYSTKKRIQQTRDNKGRYTSKMLRTDLSILAQHAREIFGSGVEIHVFDCTEDKSLIIV